MSSNRSMPLEKNKRIFKIIVIGDSSVGKTCLTYRFCGGAFPMKTEATIGVDFRERAVEVDNETIKLIFWDTAGTERFRKGMPPNFYRKTHVVILVYDVTKKESFENVSAWLEEWLTYKTRDMDTKLILIGNKSESERCVSASKARKFAKVNDMLFMETSAVKTARSDMDAIVMTIAKHAKNADVLEREATISLQLAEASKHSCGCC